MQHWKAKGLDISPILSVPENPYGQTLHQSVGQEHDLEFALDRRLIDACEPAIMRGEQVTAEFTIKNVNRTVGTMLGNAITTRHGGAGLPDGTINLQFRGSAGQSFGAFVPSGVTMTLEGDANDYVGKGLSGGVSWCDPIGVLRSPRRTTSSPATSLATGPRGGEIFLRGRGGRAVLRAQLRRDGRGRRRG